MSHIDDLIEELCPDGVEFRPLDDLLDYEQPGKYLVGSTSYNNSYVTPVLTAGQTFILGYTDETDGIYPASPDKPVVIFDDFTTACKWVDFPFKAKSSAMKMLTPKRAGLVSLRYAYYVMQTIKYAPQDHARQWIGRYSQFRVPVPPLEVQCEIVRILDLFSGLAADLRTELDAEQEARQRQYAYYRDDLFTFRDIEGVKRVPMGDIGKFIRGRRFTKNDVVEKGIPSIHYGEIYTTYGIATSEAASHIREDLAPQLRYAKPGDVVIAAVGETVEDVGKAVAWLGTPEVAIHDDCFLYRSGVLDPKFVSYHLRTEALNREKAKYVARAKVKRLSSESLAMLLIPVPSLDEQKRIVAILDEFEALVTNVSAALPAEVAARRKQYEYYRDRLLTFKEVAA